MKEIFSEIENNPGNESVADFEQVDSENTKIEEAQKVIEQEFNISKEDGESEITQKIDSAIESGGIFDKIRGSSLLKNALKIILVTFALLRSEPLFAAEGHETVKYEDKTLETRETNPEKMFYGKILADTHEAMDNYYRVLPIDESYCSSGVGTFAILLDKTGYERGKDYLIIGSKAHVYIKLIKDNIIVDPTFAQFFKKGSGMHEKIMAENGFVGTEEERDKFLIEHRTELKTRGKLGEEINAPFSGSENQEDLERANQEYLKIMKRAYFGDITNPEDSYLIDIAAKFADTYGQTIEENDPVTVKSDRFIHVLNEKIDELNTYKTERNIAKQIKDSLGN